ncbi:MAG: hypothetical protein JWO11_1645 [Nocardioides sp.]|nr:hypothetical protein [Nocardioides sp.]
MLSLSRALEQVEQRGPRYAVMGTIRRDEMALAYADTAEAAERTRERYEEDGYRQVRVHPPQGSIDLSALGRDRADAKRVLDEKTAILRAGVLRALEENRAEAEVARQAGVDRMTVRSWAGK